MRFEAEHRFAGSSDAVRMVLSDPSFYRDLELPDLSRPEVVEHSTSAGAARVLLRYEYTGQLDPMALRLLGGDRLIWTQELVLTEGGGTLRFLAEAKPDVLHGEASFSLEADGPGSVRHLTGELVVALPIVGPMAERRIVPGILGRMDIEAAAVNRRLAG